VGLEALAQLVQFLLSVGYLPGHGRRNLASAAQGGHEAPSVARRRISASGWPRPATSKTLARERVPRCRATADPGTPRASASARRACSVARPPSGAARTRTTIPRSSSPTETRPALGTTRTVTRPIPRCSITLEGDDGNEYEGSRARASRGGCEPGGEAPPNILPEPPPEPGARQAPAVDAAGSARDSGGLWMQPMSGRGGGPGKGGWYRGAHASSLQGGRGVRRFGGGDVRAGRSEGELPRARARGARVLARGRRVPPPARAAKGGPALGLLRGPADSQRQTRRPPRGGEDVQGRLPSLQGDDGTLRPA